MTLLLFLISFSVSANVHEYTIKNTTYRYEYTLPKRVIGENDVVKGKCFRNSKTKEYLRVESNSKKSILFLTKRVIEPGMLRFNTINKSSYNFNNLEDTSCKISFPDSVDRCIEGRPVTNLIFCS
jgi:hypothetical protein